MYLERNYKKLENNPILLLSYYSKEKYITWDKLIYQIWVVLNLFMIFIDIKIKKYKLLIYKTINKIKIIIKNTTTKYSKNIKLYHRCIYFLQQQKQQQKEQNKKKWINILL